MESKQDVGGSDATPPNDYHLAPRSETTQAPNSSSQLHLPALAPPAPPAASAPVSVIAKKKRGRPRKYGPDGSVSSTLSPKPISSSAPPPVIDFSSQKRGKSRPVTFPITNKQLLHNKMDVHNLGEWVSCSVGANFTPHMITVNSGEDVTMKIISFSQQGPRAICILSANGVISSVTLRQPDSSGGTLTYEGRFEILSLSGSFMLSDSGGTRSRSGGMSVSLASPDGRVVGGGVAGLLVAASPVQIVVGSFLTGSQHEQKPKKHKLEHISTVTPINAVPTSSPETEEPYSSQVQQRNSGTIEKNLTYAASSNWTSSMPTTDVRNKAADMNVSVVRGG